MPLSTGTKLDGYEILGLLGSGGMGEVYRARDAQLKRDVAIKVLPSFISADADRLRRFQQEAQAAAALNHPNILAVFQLGSYQGAPYLVSELLEGSTLRELLQQGPLPVRKSIDYGVQIARGMAAAHDKGIVHRDLKPENLFVTRDGHVKILDFGLARMARREATPDDPGATLTSATDPGVVMGTAGYMAPEQVRGEAVDHRADIFAFGAILYEMLTGTRSFRKPTSAETMTAILKEDPPPISQIMPNTPPGLQRVVHRCLEKNPAQRFHSAHDLAFALDALSDSSLSSASAASLPQKKSGARMATAAAAVAAVAVAAFLIYFFTRPASLPAVSSYVQLTHDGQPKRLIATDGSRLYMTVGTLLSRSVGEISASGGDPTPIAMPSNMFPVALSPDGSQFVLLAANGAPPSGPLWTLPVLGGSPRRLGDAEGNSAAWSPDGQRLAYGNGSDLFLANADGSQPRRLLTMKDGGYVARPVWSPDGKHLRFDVYEPSLRPRSSIWEVAADGTGLHSLFPGWALTTTTHIFTEDAPAGTCCGHWTAEGRYFAFVANGQVWALPRSGSLFHPEPKPIQLTSSPMTLSFPLPARDGRKLFAVGQTFRGQSVRYDAKTRQFSPYLGGISAEFLAFSRDRQWVAYVTYPEGNLWRSRADGSDPRQLTGPPGYAIEPHWSPDGTQIVFYENLPDQPSRIFTISPDGGTPKALIPDGGGAQSGAQSDPGWSPDGSKIIFASGPTNAGSALYILDIATHRIAPVPGSQGLYSPRWSPDGRYLAAFPSDESELHLFNIQTQKWTVFPTGLVAWPNFSRDSQYIDVLSGRGGSAVIRIHIPDGKIQQVADLKNFVYTGYFGDGSLALDPDDSPLLLRDAGSSDVYALDWQEP
jgi:serine/threonine protein kinase/dipeptidyl aminopeptidase/acylaminoacyl peptidase